MPAPDRFAPPAIAAGLLLRERLIKRISLTLRAARWVYIAAPGGYGKSAAAAQSLYYNGKGRHTWLMLNKNDNDPAVFFRRLAGAVVTARGYQKMPAAAQQAHSYEALQSWLQALAPNRYKSVLVLDNLHNITNRELLALLPMLLASLPKGLGVILISREKPLPALAAAAVNGGLELLDRDDLSFTFDEIRAYYHENDTELTDTELEVIYKETGGWAISLRAGLLSDNKKALSGHNPTRNFLKQYLDDHVWPGWDAATQDFLRKCSIKAELLPPLCNKLSGRTDSEYLLQNLLRQGAFLTRTADNTYRFHDLFREYLRRRLETETPAAEVNRLYKNLAEWEEERRDYFAALGHYVKLALAEDINRCCRKINDFNNTIAVETDLQFFQAHLAGKVTNDFILNNPYLLEMRPWVSFLAGDADGFTLWLDRMNAKVPQFAAIYPDLLETSAFMGSLDFRTPLKDIAAFVAAQIENTPPMPQEHGDKKAKASSITQNLPLFHRSMRDYSEFHLLNDDDLGLLKKSFGVLIGPEYTALELCLTGGILYEQGQLLQACRHAKRPRSCRQRPKRPRNGVCGANAAGGGF